MAEDSAYVCSLDDASVKKAKAELNENPQDRLAAVTALRDWIKGQPHIRCGQLDTQLMLQYLRGAKFSQLRAREMFEKNLTFRSEKPAWYGNVDTHEAPLQQIIGNGFITPLPQRTPQGHRIILERLALMDKGKFDLVALFRTFGLVYDYLIRSEMDQVNGFIFVFDFTGVGPKLMSKLMTKDLAEFQSKWTKCTPGRFKAFHYYNAGILFDTFMAFSKPFLPKKWIDRIMTHDSLETLYKHVPMACLPAQYLPDDYSGPHTGNLNDIHAGFVTDLKREDFRQSLLYKSGPLFGVDKSKRPQETVTQHFRKLNVD